MTKEEALSKVKGYLTDLLPVEEYDEVEEIIEALNQEPFMNKLCVAHQICHEDKIKVLDKIKAEIKEKFEGCDICEWFEDYDYEENNISEYQPVGDIKDILNIIDKYRESKG